MTVMPPAPGPLSRITAEALTQRIREAGERLHVLVLDAFEREAWRALDYPSWAAYVDAEFGMSRGQSYRLMSQGTVQQALEAAVASRARDNLPVPVPVSARQAQVLKSDLERSAEEVAERVVSGTAAREAVQQAVRDRQPAAVPAVGFDLPGEETAVEGGQRTGKTRQARAVEQAARLAGGDVRVIPTTARPVITRQDVAAALTALLAIDPLDAGPHVRDDEIVNLRRWLAATVSARQTSLEGIGRREVEPRFKGRR